MEDREQLPINGKHSEKRIVLGSLGEDIHSVSITILEHLLREHGFGVFNIGVQSSHQDFISAIEKNGARIILVLSSSGHAPGSRPWICR